MTIEEQRKIIGLQLKAIRKEKGLSQANVAKMIGVPNHQYISNCEKGKKDLTLNVIVKICNALEVELNTYISNKNPTCYDESQIG